MKDPVEKRLREWAARHHDPYWEGSGLLDLLTEAAESVQRLRSSLATAESLWHSASQEREKYRLALHGALIRAKDFPVTPFWVRCLWLWPGFVLLGLGLAVTGTSAGSTVAVRLLCGLAALVSWKSTLNLARRADYYQAGYIRERICRGERALGEGAES